MLRGAIAGAGIKKGIKVLQDPHIKQDCEKMAQPLGIQTATLFSDFKPMGKFINSGVSSVKNTWLMKTLFFCNFILLKIEFLA